MTSDHGLRSPGSTATPRPPPSGEGAGTKARAAPGDESCPRRGAHLQPSARVAPVGTPLHVLCAPRELGLRRRVLLQLLRGCLLLRLQRQGGPWRAHTALRMLHGSPPPRLPSGRTQPGAATAPALLGGRGGGQPGALGVAQHATHIKREQPQRCRSGRKVTLEQTFWEGSGASRGL